MKDTRSQTQRNNMVVVAQELLGVYGRAIG
jgi:hypothetical protein